VHNIHIVRIKIIGFVYSIRNETKKKIYKAKIKKREIKTRLKDGKFLRFIKKTHRNETKPPYLI